MSTRRSRTLSGRPWPSVREFYGLRDAGASDQDEPERQLNVAPGGERPDELWRAVAWILLIVLVIETFVANKTYA